MNNLGFGSLHIPIGSILTFVDGKTNAVVSSDGQGTLVRNEDFFNDGLCSLLRLIKKLKKISACDDIYSMWYYRNKTLRDIHGGLMVKRINLFVDDIRIAPEGFITARSFHEALEYLQCYEIGILSLDHDLGLDQDGNLAPDGYDLVKYFCTKHLNPRYAR